ncbi:hypothetical protein OAA00_10265, partial [Cyclobacteriaceae bacterium]|nr:hypothetical protein [Cyclobacteriaceae bacterium]
DVTLYTKRGDKYVIKNATVKSKNGKAYVRKANGTIGIYSMSLLDSVSGRTDYDIVYDDIGKSARQMMYDAIDDDSLINKAPITPLDDEIIEIKKDLNEFRKARGSGYFLQALGAGIAIAGSFLVISDANNDDLTQTNSLGTLSSNSQVTSTSKGPLLTGVGAGLSLVGFILTWTAGDKINYDNDIANYKKRKRKNK